MYRASSGRVICQDLSEGCERYPVRVINDVDDSSINAHFVYSSRVIDVDGILERREQKAEMFCDCTTVCDSTCVCWSGAYEVTVGEELGSRDGWKHRTIRPSALSLPVGECSSACACSLHCGNRVAQKGSSYPVEIYRTRDGRGWGLRAQSSIPRGAFIAEYTGELIDDSVANERDDKYLFETVMGEEKFTIDANYVGNVARFINHSCEPNAKVGMVSWEPHEAQLNHVCVFAARHIQRGEEITIHYGHSWWLSNITLFPCKCRAPTCKYHELARYNYLERGITPEDPRVENPEDIPP